MITNLYKKLKSSTGISINSRNIKSRNLFFGIKGENYNGNAFAKNALDKGASFVIIDDDKYLDKSQVNKYILVKDSITALQELAKYHRSKFNCFIIGITGSCGKTITKELIKNILSLNFKVYASPGNYNSHIGLPLALLSMPQNTEIGIFEMGARGFDEINNLCEIAKPTHGLITNIKEVHLDGFYDLKGVLKAKIELYDYLLKNRGIIFTNINEELLYRKSLEYIKQYNLKIDPKILKTNYKSKSYNPFYYYNIKYDINTYSYCELIKNNTPYLEYKDQYSNKVKTKILGDFNINNVSATLCISKYFNIDNNAANKIIQNYSNKDNRLEKIEKCSNIIILDSYNSNLDSLIGALSIIKNISKTHKVIILGELEELGNKSNEIHKKITEITNNSIYDKVILCGIKFSLHKKLNKKAVYLENKKELEKYLKNNSIKDSVILLKASRKFKFETLTSLI